MNDEDNIELEIEQKLAKIIQDVCKKLLNIRVGVCPEYAIFLYLNESMKELIEQHPEANIEKLNSLLEGDGEYSIASILEDSSSIMEDDIVEFETNSEGEEDMAVLGENVNEQADC